MKLVELTLTDYGTQTAVAVLPSGGMMVVDNKEGSMLIVAGSEYYVTQPYRQVVDNINAELENWKL